jgi:hypothetical protein
MSTYHVYYKSSQKESTEGHKYKLSLSLYIKAISYEDGVSGGGRSLHSGCAGGGGCDDTRCCCNYLML